MTMDDLTLERRLEAKDKLIAELVEALENIVRCSAIEQYGYCGQCNHRAKKVIRKAKGE